ncbi:response regulator [Massiliimalia massiliensis]|uniref:response regulator n=1 Tax=Massiliimalia massiliensis TaxID=1852384 RepID=UPI00098736BF|nr:response regulator [Massiliimalia massiliensis]
MYRLVLIDDEELALEHLSNCLDYTQLHIEICGTSNNGNSGLELICLNNPDIVVTDIKMPGLTGIDLLKTLSGFESPPEVIFVSGYSDFEYAKQAIQYGASDYILKPISPDELSQALQKAIIKILKKRKAAQERLELYQSFKEIQTSYEFQSLKSYLIGQSPMVPETTHLLPDNLTVYIMLTVSVSDERKRPLSDIWNQITKLALTPNTLIFDNGSISSILLGSFSDENISSQAMALAEKIIMVLEKDENLDVTIGISNVCHDKSKFPDIFAQSSQVLLQKLFFPDQKVFYYHQSHITEDQFFSKVCSTLLNYMKTADKTSVSHYLKTVFQSMHSLDTQTAITKNQTEFWCRIILEIEHTQSFIHKHIITNDLLNEWIRSMNYAKTHNELFVLVERTIYDFVDLMNSGHSANTKSVIQNALIYIEENYAQHLTLAKVAQHVYLSNSRFSTLFAEEMKEPFSKYLTNKRIEKAKELMKNPYAKIYEISYAVGFQDARYFSAVFKRSTGLTPMEYLKRQHL